MQREGEETAPSQNPAVSDQENQELTQSLYYFTFGLLLQGVPEYDKGYTLTGANVDGEIQVRGYGELNEYLPSHGMPVFKVGVAEVKRAFSLANKLHCIFRPGDYDYVRA